MLAVAAARRQASFANKIRGCQSISRSSAGSDRSWSPRSRRQGVSLPRRRPALFERREHQRNVRRTAFQPSAHPRGVRCRRRQLHHFKGRRRAGSVEFQPGPPAFRSARVQIGLKLGGSAFPALSHWRSQPPPHSCSARVGAPPTVFMVCSTRFAQTVKYAAFCRPNWVHSEPDPGATAALGLLPVSDFLLYEYIADARAGCSSGRIPVRCRFMRVST